MACFSSHLALWVNNISYGAGGASASWKVEVKNLERPAVSVQSESGFMLNAQPFHASRTACKRREQLTV
jgi:hypothetical protein